MALWGSALIPEAKEIFASKADTRITMPSVGSHRKEHASFSVVTCDLAC